MKSTGKRVAGRALSLLLMLVAGVAIAGTRLTGAEIDHAMRGITLDGIYKDGTFFSETYNDDGSIRYHDDEGSDSGDWSVKDNTFCTFYDSQEGACFFVERDGTNCFTFFKAVTGDDGTVSPSPDWTSRGWSREHASTCPKPPEAAI